MNLAICTVIEVASLVSRRCQLLMVAFAMVASIVVSAEETPATHPLMPGIRSPEMRSRDWPRTHHDKLATGFSPLICGMKTAPVEWAAISIPGQVDWLRVLSNPEQDDTLLVSDDRLRLVNRQGQELWSRSATGGLVFHGDLHGDGRQRLLMGSGRRLIELDAATGEMLWTHVFQPQHVDLVVRVADILPERPGLEAAVFLNHGEEGSLISFAPATPPEFVWQRPVVTPGEFDERYDHHSGIELDLSTPTAPVIWNVRRYRCRGIDARTGDVLSTLEYTIGGEQRRNYGTWSLSVDRGGEPLAVVLGESVQLHAHAIRLRRSGQNELAWEHYYGEVYKDAPGVALAHLAIADLDGDGVSEVAYSVRDPEQGFRSFVRIRDAETGNIVFELADHWGAAVLQSDQAGSPTLLLAFAALDGATPTQGELEAYVVDGAWPARKIGSLRNAALLQPERAQAADNEFFARVVDAAGNSTLGCYQWTTTGIERLEEFAGEPFRDANLRAILHGAEGAEVFALQANDGQLVLTERSRRGLVKLPLHGLVLPTVSAADLDADGRAELLVLLPQGRLQVYSFGDDGRAALRADYAHAARWFDQGPVAYDLLNDGQQEILRISAAADGHLVVLAERLDGEPLWQTKLDIFAAEVDGCTINPGQFLAADHSGVAVSVTDARLVREGTYLLDGRSGAVRWFKSRYRDGATIMPYRSRGVPTAIDFDGDGTEEIGMDLLSYMAFLRGVDGSFAYVRPTHNIRSENVVYGGHLYNTYCPIFADPQASRPHWFVIGGFGPFGLMKPDPTAGVWRVDLGYDVPPKIGLVDVDGDGSMEVGYAAYYDSKFVCRDLWTGKVEWELELPAPPNNPVYSADVDGDGKGEFLTAGYCIGTNKHGKGELRWQAPAAMGWGAIADFDGDGAGEIACQTPGRVVVLRRHGNSTVAFP